MSEQDQRGLRAARNESAFRDVNEQLQGVAAAEPGRLGTFVCECAHLTCAELVSLPEMEYERVRRSPERFLVAPSAEHARADVEVVVERHPTFWVVEKLGQAAEVAEELDPRT